MSEVAKRRVTVQAGTSWQPTEEMEQEAVIEWTVLMEKQYPELAMLFHIANGGDRHPAVAKKLKAQGVKAGVPDLMLPVARGGWHGLFIEMKRQKGGRLSEEQKEWIKALTDEHYLAVRANGAEEACDIIYKYLTENGQ